jgi:thiosulfate/3-mercaptopyruvate sulfurtransferase
MMLMLLFFGGTGLCTAGFFQQRHPRNVVALSSRLFPAKQQETASRLSSKVGSFLSSSFASSDNASSGSNYDSPSPFPQLYGKTLASIQACINAASSQSNDTNDKSPPRVIFIDASWYHRPDPTTNKFRSPSQEYIHGPRLPNARYVDIDSVATSHDLFPHLNPKKLPHMMPPPHLFGMAMDAYNIRNCDHIVIYAKRGAVFTPRMWFLFISMGHDEKRVHLMQGSLEDYMYDGGIVEDYSLAAAAVGGEEGEQFSYYYAEEYSKYFDDGILNVLRLYNERATSTTRYNVSVSKARHICGKDEVLEAVNTNNMRRIDDDNYYGKQCSDTIILDTRGSAYANGHMPSAIHLPYAQLVDPNNSLVLKSTSAIKQMFEERNIDYADANKKIILTCGSGVSVCHGYLALKRLGREITEENTRIYDGSWTEWRADPDSPKVTSF